MGAREFFESLEANSDPEAIEGIDHSYLFVVEDEGQWLVELRDGTVRVTEGEADADVTITVGAETFDRLVERRQRPVAAYLGGKLKVSGDTAAALALRRIF
jgi:predicted lipid carrier protein YhbT